MYHVKIVIVIDWYSCFFFFSCDLNFLYGFEISWRSSFTGLQFRDFFFFFHNPTSSPGRFSLALLFTIVKNAKLKTGKLELWRKTKKSSSYLRSGFFFSGLLVIVLQYSSRIPVACPQTPRTPRAQGSLSRFALALALADVFEKNEQKNKTTSVYRVHRKDMLAAWNNDCSRFVGRIKEKYIICLSNRSPTVPLHGRGGWGYVFRMYASPGCKHVFWRYCSRLLSRHERPLAAIYFHSL